MPSGVATVSPSSSSPSSTRASGVPGGDGRAEETAGDGSGGGKYRLMLVDDEEALRRAVSEYLEQASVGRVHLKQATSAGRMS